MNKPNSSSPKAAGSFHVPVVLPIELQKPIRRRQLMFIVFATLLAVVGINVLITFSGIVDRIDGGGRVIHKKWDILGSSSQPIDWVILGDSSADQGVDPDQFGTELGGSAVNLATVGNILAVNDVWMLDEYIRLHGAPKNVVIVHVYDLWRREMETSAFAKIPLAPGFWWSSKPSLELSLSESAELLAFRYLPLFQSKNLLKKLADQPNKLRTAPRNIQPNGFSPVLQAQPERVESDFRVHQNFYTHSPFEITQNNSNALDRLVELAEEYDFEVYIANSPIYEEMKADTEFESYFSGVRELLDDLDNRSSNIHYVLCETPGFPKELMTNVDHLTVEGAKLFTSLLADSILTPTDCRP